MNIKELAERFLRLKIDSEEKRRYIDFDRKNVLKDLEKENSIEKKLKVLHFKDETQQEELLYQQLIDELREVIEDIKPILQKVNANRNEPMTTHVHDKTYFDVFLDEEGEIQSFGYYTKLR